MGKVQNIAIKNILVRDLFGQFTYVIPKEETSDIERLLILYGDNGSGKTKILQLLYHLLSPAEKRGHRSSISKIPFRKFDVEFTNSTKISVDRSKRGIAGRYDIEITEKDKIYKYSLHISEGEVLPKKQYLEFCKFLNKLGIAVYYLSDQRQFQSDELPLLDSIELRGRTRRELEIIRRNLLKTEERQYIDLLDDDYSPFDLESIRNRDIKIAIKRIEDWLNRQVKQAQSKGEISVNIIYSDIIKSISKRTDKQQDVDVDIKDLNETLIKLAERSKRYEFFKMTTPLDIESIVESIKIAPLETYPTLKRVVQPYIDSLEARFKELEDVYKVLNSFIEGLNEFYSNKSVVFDFREGILNIVSGKKVLDPKILSSGEKQLLLLFCNTFLARDKPSLFLIDEPEISLNIKWQRKLIKALLKLTENSQVQLVLATHSIELLSSYSNNTVRLISKK